MATYMAVFLPLTEKDLFSIYETCSELAEGINKDYLNDHHHLPELHAISSFSSSL